MLSVLRCRQHLFSDRTRLHVVYCGMNVNRKELLAALTQAARVASKDSYRPSLQNVLLESVPPSKGGPLLRISSTDMETYFQTSIDAPGPGSLFRVLVNAKNARDLVKNLTGEEVAIGPQGPATA